MSVPFCLSPEDKQFGAPRGTIISFTQERGGTNISHTQEGGGGGGRNFYFGRGDKHFMLEAVVPTMMLLKTWL